MGVSGLSLQSDSSNSQSVMQEDLNLLKNSSSSDGQSSGISVHQDRVQINGIHAAASVDPQATLRVDMQAMQHALDSGDFAGAQKSLMKIIQDSQQINSATKAEQAKPTGKPTSALPTGGPDGGGDIALPKDTGNLIDVTA
jgi:hypothetical protein